METTVEQLIAERSYSSLNASEKALVSELCANETEFNQMKQFFASMSVTAASAQFDPSPELKSSLDSVFAAKHGGIGARLTPREMAPAPVAAKVIPFYQQTWARVAAGVLLLAGVISIWQLSGKAAFAPEHKQQMAKAETKQEEQQQSVSADQAFSRAESENIPGTSTKAKASVSPSPAPLSFAEESESGEMVYDDANVNTDVKTFGFEAAAKSGSSWAGEITNASSKVQAGKEADLYPDGNKAAEKRNAVNASAVSASQEDLLSYIVPAF